MPTLENRSLIVQEIQADRVMRQRWNRNYQDNNYVKGDEYDEVIESVKELSGNSRYPSVFTIGIQLSP